METVAHDGRETAYRYADRRGSGGARGGTDSSGTESGGTVLFVHGSGATHEVWKAQFRLATDRPVAALDLSGHGESDDIDADPGWGTRSAYADDVLAVADAVDARYLVGNSMGGAIVLHALLERDLDLDGVGLVGTGARLSVMEDLLAWLANDFDRAVAFLHGPDRLFHDVDPEVLDLSREAMRACGRAVTSRDYHSCHTFDVRDRLGEIGLPAIAVCGEHDQLTPPWYHEYLAEEMPDCGLCVVDDAAHMVMLERPEAFNEVLGAFLAGLE